jgi:acyl-CoA reductase-like NAD-dependent aldehyde dehydrogenase
MTADQVLQHFDCSIDEFLKLHREGNPPPTTLRKALYLEWYSNRNGRVVIQSTRLSVERIGERAFELSDEAWAEQAKQNQEEIQYFMHQLSDALENNAADLDE